MPKKTKKTKKQESTAVTKPLSPDELRKILIDSAGTSCDPKMILKKLGTTIAAWRDSESEDEGITDEVNEIFRKAMPIVALDTHYLAAESVSDRYRSFMIQFANDITQEYGCKTPSEKALAQTIAMSYGRILELSSAFNNSQHIEFLSSEKNGYYGMIAKELDRAHRQFTSSMLVLKQLKSPNLEVNIKAKTAFVAQNQQVNATPNEQSQEHKQTVYENVEPK